MILSLLFFDIMRYIYQKVYFNICETKKVGNEVVTMFIPYIIEKTQNGERACDLVSRLLEDRIILVSGEVDDEMALSVQAQLLFLEKEDPNADIKMYINSPGGYCTSGLAIADTMRYISCDIMTISCGLSASMGAFLLSCGTKGKRFSLPNSEIMVHQPSGGTVGQITDMEIHLEHSKRLKERLTKQLADNCGQSYEKMYKECERDNFMYPEEALEFGIIDGIIIDKTTVIKRKKS